MHRLSGLLLLGFFFAATAFAQPMTVTTIAGSTSGGGYIDAEGTAARFSSPHGVVVDAAGNLFVSDRGNHVIRRVTPAGDVSTFAGQAGVSGSTDGTGVAARFLFPSGLAFDPASGMLFVADSGNHTIRRITPAGDVTTWAGSATRSGEVDGAGGAARFSFPQGLAVDASGFVWVADTGNDTIRRIVGANATVTTFAGSFEGWNDGVGTAARFDSPFDVAVDSAGDLYVVDSGNHVIRKVTREGLVSTMAGEPYEAGRVDATGTAARFDSPWGIDVAPNGDIYVADSSNDTIRKITRSGVVTTVAGSGAYGRTNAVGTQASFAFPTGLAIDRGVIFVADRQNHAIRRIAVSLQVTTFAGATPSNGTADGVGTSARFHYPQNAAFDRAGNLYVADTASTIRKITPDGVVSTFAGAPGTPGSTDGSRAEARFRFPSGVAVDATDNVWVADTSNHTIRKITPDGVVTTVAGLVGTAGKADGVGTQARFNYPWALAFDSPGNLYIADAYNHLVRIMDPSGVVTVFAGTGSQGNLDRDALTSGFRYPISIAVDGNRNVYVADFGNHTIRKITPSGKVSTLAGSALSSGNADGTAAAARFDNPYGVAVDANGTVWVADTDNHELRRIAANGVVTTVAGVSGTPGNVDGSSTSSRFFYPQGVTVAPDGSIFVVDTYNQNIRRAALTPPSILQFSAAPQTVRRGDTVTLSWQTSDATTVTIDNGIGTVGATGSRSVVITQTTMFTLTANGPGGTTRATVAVVVAGSRRRAVTK